MRWSALLLPLALACGSKAEDGSVAEAMGGVGGQGTGNGGGAAYGGGNVGPPPLESELTPETVESAYNDACYGSLYYSANGAKYSIALVVDASDSMNDVVGAGTVSRWTATQLALNEALGARRAQSLPPWSEIELRLFPAQTASATDAAGCVAVAPEVALGELTETQSALLRQTLEARIPAGTSPLYDAFFAAKSAILGRVSRAEDPPPHILLVTDGMASLESTCHPPCADGVDCSAWSTLSPIDSARANTDEILNAIDDARAHGILTLVVGTEGSQEASWLSTAAVLGGTAREGCVEGASPPCHIDLSAGEKLADALQSYWAPPVAAEEVCTFQFSVVSRDAIPYDVSTAMVIAVRADGTGLLLGPNASTGSACEQGMVWLDGQTLRLCSSPCSRWLDGEFANVSVLLGCSYGPIDNPI